MIRSWIDQIRQDSFSRRYAPHQPEAPLLTMEDVSVYYETGQVLDHLTFDLERKDMVALVGPNGAGKTTLFKVIAGILDPVEGIVRVSGHEPGGHTCIAYVPQRSQVDWTFPVTVSDVVMMGRINKMGPLLWPQPADWKVVNQALQTVGMTDFKNRQISELSGGQQQRMFIARALAQEAELMLLDEPLNGLDAPAQEKILNILDSLVDQGVTLIISMHDLKLAADRFPKVMLLNKQLLGFGTPDAVFSREKLLNAYQGHLHFIGDDLDSLAVGATCCEGDEHELV
jgi:ABC-type Mn2+/Zn2+ transport system ATPase subunit